jgi:hypothetical protein
MVAGVAGASFGLLGAIAGAFYLKRKRSAEAGGRKVAPAGGDPFDPVAAPKAAERMEEGEKGAMPELPSTTTRGKRVPRLKPLQGAVASPGLEEGGGGSPASPDAASSSMSPELPEIRQVQSRVRVKKLGANKVEPLSSEVPTLPSAEGAVQNAAGTLALAGGDGAAGIPSIAAIGSVPGQKRRVRLAKKGAAVATADDAPGPVDPGTAPMALPELGSVVVARAQASSSTAAPEAEAMVEEGKSNAAYIPAAKTMRRRAKNVPVAAVQVAAEAPPAPLPMTPTAPSGVPSSSTSQPGEEGGVGYGQLFQRKGAPSNDVPSPDRVTAEHLLEEDLDLDQ